jgi:hypothetical protein
MIDVKRRLNPSFSAINTFQKFTGSSPSAIVALLWLSERYAVQTGVIEHAQKADSSTRFHSHQP